MGIRIFDYTEFFAFIIVLTLLLNDGFGQSMRSRYLETKLRLNLINLKAEYEGIMQNFPQGVIIYQKMPS